LKGEGWREKGGGRRVEEEGGGRRDKGVERREKREEKREGRREKREGRVRREGRGREEGTREDTHSSQPLLQLGNKDVYRIQILLAERAMVGVGSEVDKILVQNLGGLHFHDFLFCSRNGVF
jgi:hypothetical protein